MWEIDGTWRDTEKYKVHKRGKVRMGYTRHANTESKIAVVCSLNCPMYDMKLGFDDGQIEIC